LAIKWTIKLITTRAAAVGHISILEDYLSSKLQAAPSNAVGYDVAGKGVATIGVELKATKLFHTERGVGRVVYVLNWYSKPLMIKHIESLRLELEGKPLSYFEVLKNS